MKCPICKGEPKIIRWTADQPRYICCERCGGTGEVESVSNEEYLRSCSSEQLAEFLSKIGELDEAPIPCGDLMECSKNCGLYSQCAGDDVMPTNEEIWVEWLKQPHGGESCTDDTE